MSEFRVDVDIEGLIVKLQEMQDRCRDLRPAWEAWGDDVAEAMRHQFETEGQRFGRAWERLSPRYAAWKAVHYPGKTILRRTDRLRDSLARRPLAIERVTHDSAEFGTDVPYAVYHQRGTRKMPARPILGDDPELIRKAHDHVASWITEGRP